MMERDTKRHWYLHISNEHGGDDYIEYTKPRSTADGNTSGRLITIHAWDHLHQTFHSVKERVDIGYFILQKLRELEDA